MRVGLERNLKDHLQALNLLKQSINGYVQASICHIDFQAINTISSHKSKLQSSAHTDKFSYRLVKEQKFTSIYRKGLA